MLVTGYKLPKSEIIPHKSHKRLYSVVHKVAYEVVKQKLRCLSNTYSRAKEKSKRV